jgi:hypothetical protein
MDSTIAAAAQPASLVEASLVEASLVEATFVEASLIEANDMSFVPGASVADEDGRRA